MTEMSLLDTIHGGYVFKRRVRVLSAHLSQLIPPGARVLDVGCGDGLIAKLIMERRPDTRIEGIDVLVRPNTHVPVTQFDGGHIPHEDASFEVVMFVDVLHHTEDPVVLLREARRVARRAVVLKDHCRDGLLAGPTLRFMDWVGNARHGVVLPYNYWPRRQWDAAFAELQLIPEEFRARLSLYPFPASFAFERSLHFIARLGRRGA
jgi:SAM-dependent methyltransferase